MFEKYFFRKKGHWIAIIVGSLLCSLVFSVLRGHRVFAHLASLNIIEYFGYGSKAFLLSLPLFFIGFLALYYLLIRAFQKGKYQRKAIAAVVVIAILSSLFYTYPGALLNWALPPIQPDLHSSETYYVVFTFDTEEDWEPYRYYNSYKYITSGAFYRLVDGLAERNVSATFFVTPNLARDMPEVLNFLEDSNQTVGVHLHPHTLVKVNYPYESPYAQTRGDDIGRYSFREKLRFMTIAKDEIEAVVGHTVLLYRSGKLSCDYEVEKIAKDLGYEAISNHKGTYYIEPIGIWNLDVADDVFNSEQFDNLVRYTDRFNSRSNRGHIVIFSGHPMLLYDHGRSQVNAELIGLFFEFVDWLKDNEDVQIINQYQLLELIKE